MAGRRGRPPRIARNIAIWLAHTWFEEAEGLSAWKACLAVRDLWVRRGFIGLGGPGSHGSKAIYPMLEAGAKILGAGQIAIWPGRRYRGRLFGAGATFVPACSRLLLQGRTFQVDGCFWDWRIGWEQAELHDDRDAPWQGVEDRRNGALAPALLAEPDRTIDEERTTSIVRLPSERMTAEAMAELA